MNVYCVPDKEKRGQVLFLALMSGGIKMGKISPIFSPCRTDTTTFGCQEKRRQGK